jgi:hypothetical protein
MVGGSDARMSHLLRQANDDEFNEFAAVQLMYLLYTSLRLDNMNGTDPSWTPGKCSPAQVDI